MPVTTRKAEEASKAAIEKFEVGIDVHRVLIELRGCNTPDE